MHQYFTNLFARFFALFYMLVIHVADIWNVRVVVYSTRLRRLHHSTSKKCVCCKAAVRPAASVSDTQRRDFTMPLFLYHFLRTVA